MKNQGVILLKLRQQRALPIKVAAKLIGRSVGWLSGVENCKQNAKISDEEYRRILKVYGAENDSTKFASWVAVEKRKGLKKTIKFDGAILKYLRKKNNLSILEVSKGIGFSIGYISKIENGAKRITIELRDKFLKFYGYSPGSYKNFSTKGKRSKSVPLEFKIKIALKNLNDSQVEKLWEFIKGINKLC